MCVNKVYVKDFIHFHRQGNYFPCGRCKACRQLLANRRASKIRNHEPKDTVCYFVNLTYYNHCLPYISRAELREVAQSICCGERDNATINIYRDSYISRGFGSSFVVKKKVQIGTIDIENCYAAFDLLRDTFNYKPCSDGTIKGILGIRTVLRNNVFKYDSDKISVAYTPDSQKFVKRLRSLLEYDAGKKVSISYYYAPEYGPTTHRFHIHYLIWFPSRYTEKEVKHYIFKAWPFCDRNRLFKYIQVARAASNYVASYVNKSDDVPQSLIDFAPLKSSHSLAFGFNEDLFEFRNFIETFRRSRRVTFTTTVLNDFGVPEQRDLLYPQYVNNRFFPKVKGFNRCSRDTLRLLYLCPEKYLSLRSKSCGLTLSLEKQYASNLIDVYGIPVIFTEIERNYYLNSINRFRSQLRSVDINYIDAVNLLLDYYTARASYLYLSQFDEISSNHMCFYNLPDVYSGRIHAPTVEPYLDTVLSVSDIHCNNLPLEVFQVDRLIDKYNRNCHTREINNL